ncbi:hypothetical protein AKJ18_07205 [Vibrio xuii]|nr:hypothetical protein AKJ18_07205 [Vibrio xuii]
MTSEHTDHDVLCCPLCGSEEYLLSSNDKMLCAECGSFFEDIKSIIITQPVMPHISVCREVPPLLSLPMH